MGNLKPCPFCGREADMMTSSDGFTSIGCLHCNPIFGIMVQGMTKEEASELWNNRHEQTCHQKRTPRMPSHSCVCSRCAGLMGTLDRYCPNCGAKVTPNE